MYRQKLLCASIALALIAPVSAQAADRTDLAQMRREIDELKAAYEARIRALEQRLGQAETEAREARQTATESRSEAQQTREAVARAESPQPVAPSSSDSAFNPAISLILSGTYVNTSRDPANYAITGFPLPAGAEIGPGSRGFSLAESELGVAANIDPYLRGALNLALHGDDSVSVEEAYIQTIGLSNGLTAKAGRFFSGIGYLNAQHAHTWDFADNPLAYQAFLGTQFGDDGVQLKWLAPTDTFLEFGAEIGRGRAYPGSDNAGNGVGAWSAYAHVGGDLGESSSWRAGLSLLQASAREQGFATTDLAGATVNNAFSGHQRVWIADGVWKWAPNGNATRRNFKLQGEYLRSEQHGDLAYDIEGINSVDRYRAAQSGWYLQGVYQFMPNWRFGLRTERLSVGTIRYGANAAYLAANDYDPTRHSLMLDFNPSEFSRIRLQFSQDRARQGLTDNQFFVQYQMSLGAHGAHSF